MCHSAGTPDSGARTDTNVKKLNMTIARISSQMSLLEDIARELVKKKNHDNDMSAERGRTIKASLRAANKTIAILRTSSADKDLLDLRTPEEVPASTTKLLRLDENTYIKDKMAARQATSANAAPFENLLEAAAGDDEF